jgi:[protein-PII] uridylyltransferase
MTMAGGSRLRPSVLAARQQLAESREDIKRRHMQGLPSVQVCARLTTMVDAVVTQLFDAALAELGGEQADSLRSRVALVAHGGYGRRHLAPFSDVDLMVLHDGRDMPHVEQLAARLTQDIFDVGLQLGHSLRTPTDAVGLARGDAVICSSLIESRLVVGSQVLADGYWKSFRTMVDRRQAMLCRSFVQARKAEGQKFGGTVYLLEPNVKRSKGGLRDTHLLRWLWFAKTGIADPDRLLAKGVISRFDHHRLRSARDFLLQVRNHMHFAADNGSDVLTRAVQIEVAKAMGFFGREGLLPVEQFMREYFRHSTHVSFLANRLIELATPVSGVRQVLDPMLSLNITRDYRIGTQEISVTQAGATKLKSRLDEVLRLVDLARLHDRRISQETWYMVYRAAPNYSSELTSPVVGRFCSLLENPAQLGDSLRRLRDLGVLEKLITQFAHARGLLQFNQYHKYTVDEHCIRAVEEATRLAQRSDLAGERYRKLKNKMLLHLALLIHDLGKGFEQDHSVLGEQIAHEVADRLSLEPSERSTLAYLVREHLSLAHAAFRRDTSDTELIAKFAQQVGNVERLDLLYLLTCADLAAVGPGVLNAWKVSMLSDLRQKIEDALQPGRQFFSQSRRDELHQQVWQQLPADCRDDPWYAEQFLAISESYLTSHQPRDIALLLTRLRPLAGREGVAWGTRRAENNTLEFTAGVDQGSGRGIFAAMAGVLSSRNLRILAAETAALAHGLLLLRYVVEDDATVVDASQLGEISQRLVAAIDSDSAPKFPRIWGREQQEATAALSHLPNEVRIDTRLSSECAIVEVFTFDRLGLLYHLARALHELGLNIRFAKIGTYLDQVVDVFYVAERDGTKPESDERLLAIREAMEGVIEATS